MKRFILLFGFLLTANLVMAQFGAARSFTSTADTLTNADTVEVLFPRDIVDVYNYGIHIRADSSTGTPAGTVWVQGRETDTDVWANYHVLTIANQAAPIDTVVTGVPHFRKLRIYILTTGTQSTPYFIQGKVTRRNW